MKELDIQLALKEKLMSGSQISMPNYTPSDWWECDFMHITKSGYLVEHEIKVSRGDFFADSKKSRAVWGTTSRENPNGLQHFKHDLLGQGHKKGPKQFWYVVPENLVTPEECPDFAGLKYAREVQTRGGSFLTLDEIKKAPILHKEKASEKIKEHAFSVCYYRYWNEKEALASLRKRKLMEEKTCGSQNNP